MSEKNYTTRARQLMMVATTIIDNLDDLYKVYQELLTEVDYNNPSENEAILPIMVELEHNLVDLLDQVHGQLYLATGIYEPIPHEEVEDFEAAVLTTLGKLDTIDLEKYRVERFDHE